MVEPDSREVARSNVLERVSDAIVSLNGELEYTFANPQAEQLLDTTEESLRGTYIWDAFPQGRDTVAEQNITAALETGQEQTFDRYNETLDRWFDVRVYPDEDGLTLLFTDISERKEREQELERYEQIIETLPVAVGINIPGEKGNFEYVNQAAVEMLGASSKTELRDYSPSDTYPDTDERKEISTQLRETDSIEQYETQLTTLDGETFWGSMTATLTEIGGTEYIIGIIEDITERKQTERELKESKDRIAEQNEALISFTEIVTDTERTTHQQITDLLELGVRYLSLDVGILSEINNSDYTVRNVIDPAESIEPGSVYNLADTYCSLVYDADGPVAFHNSGDGDVTDHPAYHKQGIESYIGVPVWTSSQRYGTLNFSQPESREEPFTDTEEAFVRIMAQWIGRELEQQQREQELERTSQFLKDTQEVAQVGGWEVGLQSETLRWSDEVYHIHGLPLDANPTPEEGIEFYHPDDRDTMREAFDRLTTEGEQYDLELRIVRADNDDVRWVRTRGEPVYEDDKIVAVHGTFQDITERKEREQELNRSQQIIENATDVATIIDPEGTITYVSPAIQNVLGYEPDELIGTDGFGYQPQETSAAVAEAIEHVLENPTETKTVQTQFQRADGSWAWIESTLRNRVDDDVIGGILVSSRDITERKEREQKLQRDRVFLERSPAAITVLDETGMVNYQSPTSERVFGHPAEEIKDHLAFEYMHPEDRDSVAEKFTDLVDDSGGSRTVEYRYNDGDGNWRWIQSSATYYLEEPVIDGILVASVDISERKEVEQRFKRQRDNLEVLNKVLRHDIRNDLQLVLTYAEMLDHSLETNKEYVDEILTSVRSAIDLTTSVKNVADVMLGAQTELNHFDLRNVLSQEITDTRDSYENALVTTDGTIPSVEVPGDEMIGSVFGNLITNAIEHNDKDTPEVTVSAHEADGHVEVCVADNGPGISDERRTEIFEEGKKGLDSSGTGLGLYLVQTLVNRYGGEVRIGDSKLDGAEFAVQLPTIGSRRDD